MFQVGDTIFGGRFVILDIRNNYHVFEVQSAYLGDATGPFIIGFDADQSVEEINAVLGQ